MAPPSTYQRYYLLLGELGSLSILDLTPVYSVIAQPRQWRHTIIDVANTIHVLIFIAWYTHMTKYTFS